MQNSFKKKKESEEFRYTKVFGGQALDAYILVSLVKGIVWLIKTPIKWGIKKIKSAFS